MAQTKELVSSVDDKFGVNATIFDMLRKLPTHCRKISRALPKDVDGLILPPPRQAETPTLSYGSYRGHGWGLRPAPLCPVDTLCSGSNTAIIWR